MTKQKLPIAVLTQCKPASDEEAEAFGFEFGLVPPVNLFLLFDLESLEKMVQQAKEGSVPRLEWKTRSPNMNIFVEVRDSSKTGISQTMYGKAAADEGVMDITTV